MKYRISEIKLDLKEDKSKILDKLAKKAKISQNQIRDYTIVRESIDARKKPDIKLVYTVDFETDRALKLNPAPDLKYIEPEKVLEKDKKIMVVGFGPAGIFAGLTLAQMGYNPIIIERGTDVDTRTQDVESFWKGGPLKEESNVQYGEGGAGAFSDGKLTTGISNYRIHKVLNELHKHGGPEEILYKHKPHVGTDLLKGIVKNIRQEIISLGGQVRFSTKLVDFNVQDDNITSVKLETNHGIEELQVDEIILAIGHSARDTFRMLYDKGLTMDQKQFSMGFRIEHPQEMINKSQYGDPEIAKILGAADYKLSYRTKEENRGVYTFCMCPGGEVIKSSSSKGQVLSNGMSYHARDSKFANSALLVDVRKTDYESDHPLAGMFLQEKVEAKAYELSDNFSLLEADVASFEGSDLYKVLPEFISKSIIEVLPALGRKLKGFDGPKARFKGPETRSSSPVRFFRDENYRANIKNIHPCGEGAGYAGGIMSAAVDGIMVAEKIISGK